MSETNAFRWKRTRNSWFLWNELVPVTGHVFFLTDTRLSRLSSAWFKLFCPCAIETLIFCYINSVTLIFHSNVSKHLVVTSFLKETPSKSWFPWSLPWSRLLSFVYFFDVASNVAHKISLFISLLPLPLIVTRWRRRCRKVLKSRFSHRVFLFHDEDCGYADCTTSIN